MAVTLYPKVGKGKARRYQKVNLGPGRRPLSLAGPYFLRCSLPDGTRPWEPVGNDLDAAVDAQKQKQAYFEALNANVPLIQAQDESNRTKINDAVFQWFAELQIFQGKDRQGEEVSAWPWHGFFCIPNPLSRLQCGKCVGASAPRALLQLLAPRTLRRRR